MNEIKEAVDQLENSFKNLDKAIRGLLRSMACTAFLVILSAILILLALLLGGCVHVRHGAFEYWRLGNQQIGEALLTLPDGSELLLDGQKSELPQVEITATSITIGGKEVKR